MKDYAVHLWNTYREWPWWKKVIGSILLLLIGSLFILAILRPSPRSRSTTVDNWVTEQHNTQMDTLEKDEAVLVKELETKKEELNKSLDAAQNVLDRGDDRKVLIQKAETMEDLDALQKRWGL